MIRKILLTTLVLCFCLASLVYASPSGQGVFVVTNTNQITSPVTQGTWALVGAPPYNVYVWDLGAWQLVTNSTGTNPTGSAGGDLNGTYPNPTVNTVTGGHTPVITTNGINVMGTSAGNYNMGSHKITNQAAPTASGDGLVYGQAAVASKVVSSYNNCTTNCYSATPGDVIAAESDSTGNYFFGNSATGSFDYGITFANDFSLLSASGGTLHLRNAANLVLTNGKVKGLIVGTVSGDSLAFGLNHLNDLATATNVYNMGGNQINGLANGAASTDAATVGQLPTVTVSKLNTQTGNFLAVVSNASSGNLYSYSVPGNTLGIDGVINCAFHGVHNNNSGNSDSTTLTISYGSVNLVTSPNTSPVPGQFNFDTDFTITEVGATNRQLITSKTFETIPVGPGFQYFTLAGKISSTTPVTTTVDTTVAQNLVVSVTQTSASTISTSLWSGSCTLTAP